MILVVGILFTLGMAFFPIIHNLELRTLTLRQLLFVYSKQPERTAPIALIEENNDTWFKARDVFGYLWRREAFAYVVRFMRRSNPKALVFDISFNGGEYEVNTEGEQLFLDELMKSSNVASTLVLNAEQEPDFDDLPDSTRTRLLAGSVKIEGLDENHPLYDFTYQGLVPPFSGILNTPTDFYSATGSAHSTDGQIRYWVPVSLVGRGKTIFPHIALALYNDNKPLRLTDDHVLRWDGGSIDLGEQEKPVIKWYANLADKKIYPSYSLWEVVVSELTYTCREPPIPDLCKVVDVPGTPPVEPEAFNGRYVLVGEVLENFRGDNHSTIFDSMNGRKYPGVYILANTLDNLISGDFVLPAPFWMNVLFFIIWVALSLWAVMRFNNLLWLGGLTASFIVGHTVISVLAYQKADLWINMTYPILGILLCFTLGAAYRFVTAERQRRQLRFAFGKYVSPSVMKIIEKNPETISLGGQRSEITVLFCDIQGFTTFSESHTPEEVQAFLTRFFGVMNDIILNRFDGTINKLMGDAIMAYWGFPLQGQNHALQAVRAALAMKAALAGLRKEEGLEGLNIRIGINTGPAVVGNIGSEDFMDFTIIGDTVNTAARLEALNKEYGTRIMISGSTWEKIREHIECRELGTVQVRGKEEETYIYEPLSGKI